MKIHPRESVVLASDFQVLVDWCQQVLDFKVSHQVGEDYHYCNLENENGIRLGIASAEEMGVKLNDRKSNTVVLQFQVTDVKGFLKHVSDNGGKIIPGPSRDKKDAFWFGGFSDLEGNPIWIVDENCP